MYQENVGGGRKWDKKEAGNLKKKKKKIKWEAENFEVVSGEWRLIVTKMRLILNLFFFLMKEMCGLNDYNLISLSFIKN